MGLITRVRHFARAPIVGIKIYYHSLAFATLTKFYATAWKAGAWPNTVHNKAFLWSRPHPKNAVATSDSVARPTNYQWVRYFFRTIIMKFC